MASMAFVLGVLPLALAHGAGAGSQNAIGTGVIGGTLAATVIAIFFIPMFYWGLQTMSAQFFGGPHHNAPADSATHPGKLAAAAAKADPPEGDSHA